jgi:hypothetical protein
VRRIVMLLAVALVVAAMAVAMAMPTFAAQPQSGQPGLTEGQNGPPPYPLAYYTH